jgi:putative MATE family efflux protein
MSRSTHDDAQDRQQSRRVESQLEDLGDPEFGASLPSSTLVAAAGVAPYEDAAAPRSGAKRAATREILSLSWPVMLSQGLVAFGGLVDRAMIGRVGGDESAAIPLAAVGFATQFFFLIQSALFAVGLACVAMMARAIGAGNIERARESLAASLQVAAVVSIVLMAGMLAAARPALLWLGAEPAVIEAAIPYLQWIMSSSLMLAIALVIESALRADRDTRTPMFVAFVVTLCKLALNWLLIFGNAGFPALGLRGAGIATAASQALGVVAFVAVLVRSHRESPLALRPRQLVRIGPLFRDVVRIALPGIGERLINNFALLFYFFVLSRYYGTLAVAAYTVGVALLSFTWIPGNGYAQACSTLVGQALGARRPQDATRIGWLSAALALGTAIVLGIVCLLFREELARLFTSDRAVIAALLPFMTALAIAQPFLQLHFTLGGAHRGAGDTFTPLVASAVGSWVFRVPLACVAAMVLDLDVVWVWYAILFDHVSRALWLTRSFHRGRWREKLGE